MAYRDELEAALARAEAAERNLAAVCFIHPQAPAMTKCAGCGRGICDPCTMSALEGGMCARCYAAAHARRRRRQVLLLVGTGAAALGLAAGVVLFLGHHALDSGVAPEVAHQPTKHDLHAWKTRSLEDTLGREPCNQATALDLAAAHNEDGDYAKTIAFADAFEGRCGVVSRLLWNKLYAHEQRGDWQAAAQIATRLIDSEPADSDFWWWRGRAHAELGNQDQAVADFRQSMAEQMNDQALNRFTLLMEKQGRPCEAAFAFRSYVDAYPDDD